MKALFSLLSVVMVTVAFSQPSQKAADDSSLPLDKRYEVMKSGSQTFKDYKVIKESVLDKVWKITTDSITKQKQLIAEANKKMIDLHSEVKSAQESLRANQASMEEVVYDSTHITVLGVPFTKSFFLLLIAVLVGGLVFVVSAILTRTKMLQSKVKEKVLIADSIANEFEEFKKKSMEKQTKLSRELQNERNKLMELRRS